MSEDQSLDPQVCAEETAPAEDIPEENLPSRNPSDPKPVKKGKKKTMKVRKPPLIIFRILFQFASALLCLLLTVFLLSTILLVDTRILTSSDSIKTIITALTTSDPTSNSQPDESLQTVGGNYRLVTLADYPEDVSIPSDVLTNSSALTDYIYDMIVEQMGEDANISKDQVQTFIEESTVTDYLADKAAAYVDDILSGTEETEITVEEIMNLIEENKTLIEETFEVTIEEEHLAQIEEQLETVIVEEGLNETIRQSINEAVETPIGDTDYSVNDILQMIGQATQPSVILLAGVICLVLIGLILLCNYYRLPMGMCWISYALVIVGLLLGLPTALLQFAPEVIAQYFPDLSSLTLVISGLVGQLAPIHYAVLVVGVALNIAGIVLNILWLIGNKARKLLGG